MDRDQKAAAIAEIADDLRGAQAVFAVDYRGITVTEAGELRTRLREADASFRVVKNTLTQRAADEAGAEPLKAVLTGPTALTFVRGDAALAAKALRTFQREREKLEFKGGMLGADALSAEQITDIAKLPSREQLIAQFAGVVASPITGLVRSLGGLLGGLAVALGQVQEKMASGELPSGAAPAAPAAEADPEAAPATETDAGDQDAEPPAEGTPSTDDPAEGGDDTSTEPADGGDETKE
jgi:large subunit ribosomal protein L10